MFMLNWVINEHVLGELPLKKNQKITFAEALEGLPGIAVKERVLLF